MSVCTTALILFRQLTILLSPVLPVVMRRHIEIALGVNRFVMAVMVSAVAVMMSAMASPTPGISRTSSGARNFASSPGKIQRTPLGLACPEETFAIRRELPIPTEQFNPVSALMR